MFSFYEEKWLHADEVIREQWSVRNWLEKNGWGEYVSQFHDQAVHDISTLRSLSQDDLKGLGISKIGDRRKFLSQIHDVPNSDASNSDTPTATPKSPLASGGSLANLRAARAASVTSKPCGMCDDAPSVVNCTQCEEAFCDECNSEMHASGSFRLHTRTPIGAPSSASQPRLGQNANMVRVLAQRAAQDSKQEFLRALGAEEHQVIMSPRGSITPRLSAMMRSPMNSTRTSSIKRSRLSELTEVDEDAESFALGPSTMSSPSALGEGLQSLRSRHSGNDISTSTTVASPAAAESFESVLALAANKPMPAQPLPSAIEEEDDESDISDLSDLDLDTDTDSVMETPRPKAFDSRANSTDPSFPSPFLSSGPSTPGMFTPPRPSKFNLNIAPALLAAATPPDAGQARLTRARGTLGFSPLRTSIVAGAGEVAMTRGAQDVLAKTKQDAATALQEARKAGEEAARARARADDETRDMHDAEEDYANKRAVAQVLHRKARPDDEEAQAVAKRAEQEAAAALQRLELERAEQAEASKAEQAAMRTADAALAKQYQATEQMRQVAAVAQGVSKPVLQLTPAQVVVRVQAWGWETGRRRGQLAIEPAAGTADADPTPTHPLACVEVRLDELLDAARQEAAYLAAQEEDDEDEETAGANRGRAKKPVAAPPPAPPMTLPAIRRVLAERVHAHISAARAAESAAFLKCHGTCFNFGDDTQMPTQSMTAVLAAAPPAAITAADLLSRAGAPPLNSAPSTRPTLAAAASVKPILTSTPSVKPGIKRGPTISIRSSATPKASKSAIPPPSALAAAAWVHPSTGDSLDELESLQGLLPAPAQQLHALRRRPEIYGSADAFEEGDRAPGCAGEPLLHAYRLDLAECHALWAEDRARYTPAVVRDAESSAHWRRWTEKQQVMLPVDVVLAPGSTMTLPGAPPAAKAFKFVWAEHCPKEERDRLLRVCACCQRYFSDDVNHGSACMKHSEKKVNLLGDVPAARAASVKPQMVLHPCCGSHPVSLAPPPPLAHDMRGMGMGMGDGPAEHDMVLSDDDAQEDVDLALEVAEDEEDIVGYSTAPGAKRVPWRELYAGEQSVGCVPSRHEGAVYRPLRLRALTVAEQRLRRAEELRRAQLAELQQQSSVRHRTTIDQIEVLSRALRSAQQAYRGGAKSFTLCVFDGAVGRVDKHTGRRLAPWISFEVAFDTPADKDAARSWSGKVLVPLQLRLRKLKVTNEVTLHCPWSLVPVADMRALEMAFQPETNTVDVVAYGPKKPVQPQGGMLPPRAVLDREFAHLRQPEDLAVVAAQASSSPHWAQTERGLAVRTCKLCGELFQTVRGPQPAHMSAGEWDAMHAVGCSKFDLTHPADSKVVWPPTLSLAQARRRRDDRKSFEEAALQQHKAAQIQGLASSLLRAYGDYAAHAHTQAESDDEEEEDWADGDEDEADLQMLRGHEADMDAESAAARAALPLGAARLTCCLRSEQRVLVLDQPRRINQSFHVLNLSRPNADAAATAADSAHGGQGQSQSQTLRGWRLLPGIEFIQTPKQAAESAMLMQQRDRAAMLQLRLFADRAGARRRGQGQAPLLTVPLRVCESMNMSVVRFRVLRAWENEEGRDRTIDWREDIVLRHPVTGQRFEAVTAAELETFGRTMTRKRAPCARVYAHAHSEETLERESADRITSIAHTPGTEGVSARAVWHETPMADAFGPGLCLTDWCDALGRVDIVISVKAASFMPAAKLRAPEPALAALQHQAVGAIDESIAARFTLQSSADTHFGAAVVGGTSLTAHPHAWPAELKYCARICTRCNKMFCLALQDSCDGQAHQGPIALPLRFFLGQ